MRPAPAHQNEPRKQGYRLCNYLRIHQLPLRHSETLQGPARTDTSLLINLAQAQYRRRISEKAQSRMRTYNSCRFRVQMISSPDGDLGFPRNLITLRAAMSALSDHSFACAECAHVLGQGACGHATVRIYRHRDLSTLVSTGCGRDQGRGHYRRRKGLRVRRSARHWRPDHRLQERPETIQGDLS